MKALIIANGKPPRKSDLLWLRKRGYEFLIAADGGANWLAKVDILPDLIIGDLDSIGENALRKFEERVKIKKIKRQNDTDVEKAIKYAVSKKFEEVILLGASGDRLDHTLCNIGNLLKYADKIKIGMLHEKSFARVYKGEFELRTEPGETISFYAFSDDCLITARGLKYKLENEPLPFGVRSSTSNVALGKAIKIKAGGCKIILIREFAAIKRNDFLFDT